MFRDNLRKFLGIGLGALETSGAWYVRLLVRAAALGFGMVVVGMLLITIGLLAGHQPTLASGQAALWIIAFLAAEVTVPVALLLSVFRGDFTHTARKILATMAGLSLLAFFDILFSWMLGLADNPKAFFLLHGVFVVMMLSSIVLRKEIIRPLAEFTWGWSFRAAFVVLVFYVFVPRVLQVQAFSDLKNDLEDKLEEGTATWGGRAAVSEAVLLGANRQFDRHGNSLYQCIELPWYSECTDRFSCVRSRTSAFNTRYRRKEAPLTPEQLLDMEQRQAACRRKQELEHGRQERERMEHLLRRKRQEEQSSPPPAVVAQATPSPETIPVPTAVPVEPPSASPPELVVDLQLIPPGKEIAVELVDAVSSRTHHPGDQFTARLSTDVLHRWRLAFSQGELVQGRILAITKERATFRLEAIMQGDTAVPLLTNTVSWPENNSERAVQDAHEVERAERARQTKCKYERARRESMRRAGYKPDPPSPECSLDVASVVLGEVIGRTAQRILSKPLEIPAGTRLSFILTQETHVAVRTP